MEEPQEVHTDENRALPEKKQKRIVKTPAQVAALENFYNEHKYPTEVMKQDLADSIGLTEKQVSGWFCHRRLKDKKPQTDHEIQPPPGGKQDRSSGVIQDRGSGLRQDSCGSTKQGDTNKQSDPKEVESRRFTSQNIPPTQIQHHNNLIMHHHHDNDNDNDNDNDDDDDDDDDDTSSGSSSLLKDGFRPQNVDRVGAMTSKYPSHDFKSVRGPSGYLKVKGQVENAAITAVKRQLGRHYREDGPPLGIEFEALPPGAFEIPVKIPVNQSYYVGDRTVLHSPDGSRTFQPPNASKMMYERYNPKSYNSMDLDDSRHASSKHREKHFDTQYNNSNNINNKQTPHHFSKVIRHSHPQMEVNDDSAEETSVQDMRDHFETRVKHGQSVRRQDSVSNRHLIGYGKNTNHNSRPPKVNYRDRVDSLTSDLTVKRDEFVELEDRGMSRKTPKDNDFDGERRGVDDYSKLISTKIHHGNEMRVTKRNREDFVHQIYPRKEAVIDIPSRTIMTKRPPAQMTSSFSDDETAETTSSAD